MLRQLLGLFLGIISAIATFIVILIFFLLIASPLYVQGVGIIASIFGTVVALIVGREVYKKCVTRGDGKK